MAIERNTVITKLKQAFNKNFFVRTTEEFDGTKNGLWVSNENPVIYSTEEDETDHRLQKVLFECDWYVEPYDAGTLFLFPR